MTEPNRRRLDLRAAVAGAAIASAFFAGGAIAQTNGGGGSGGGGAGNGAVQGSGGAGGGAANSGGSSGGANSGGSSGRSNAQSGPTVPVGLLTGDPSRYFGQTVTTAGVVGKVLGPRTVSLIGEDAIQDGNSGPNSVAVILTGPLPDVPGRTDANRIQPGDPIQVTGQFGNFIPLHKMGIPQEQHKGVEYQGVPTITAPTVAVAGVGVGQGAQGTGQTNQGTGGAQAPSNGGGGASAGGGSAGGSGGSAGASGASGAGGASGTSGGGGASGTSGGGGANSGTSGGANGSGGSGGGSGAGSGGSGGGGNGGATSSGPTTNANSSVVGPSALVQNPTQWLGRTFTTAGVVTKINGPASFDIAGEDAVQQGKTGPEQIQVVLSTPVPDVPGRPNNQRLKVGDPVSLTGTMKNLVDLPPFGGPAGTTGPRVPGTTVGYNGVPTVVAQRLGIAWASGGAGNGSAGTNGTGSSPGGATPNGG